MQTETKTHPTVLFSWDCCEILLISLEYRVCSSIFKCVQILCHKSCRILESIEIKTQQTFTSSKSTIEALNKVWNIFKVNNKGGRAKSKMAKHTLKILRCEHSMLFKVCLAILTLFWCLFFVNFEHMSHLFLKFLLLTLNM